MIVLAVLGIAILVFRGLGFAGIESLASWEVSTRFGLGVMFLFTATAHFTSMKKDLERMIPSWVLYPRAMVYFTGVCEILGAMGLFIPSLQMIAGIGLIIFLIAVLPANINAARTGSTLRGNPPTPLALRIPMQILFILLIWWSAI
ncbi:MAG: hypothetical protein C5B54_06625 [Acidobacteria bacterium]|nr:MAG: hypothetical protein C5B54_06625 [Acidobacteriota bacterium]